MGRRSAVLAVLAAAAAIAAPSAHARQPLRALPAAGSPVVTDGARWAAFRADAAHVRVIDARTRRSRLLPLAGGDCAVAGVSDAGVLATCRPRLRPSVPPACFASHPGRLLDLRTGHAGSLPFPPRAQLPENASCDFVAAGRHWVQLRLDALHFRDDYYVARDGAGRRLDIRQPRVIADLDAPGLTRPLCAPLRQRIDDENPSFGPIFVPYEYERPFGVTSDPAHGLLLERCGRRTPRVLSRCRVSCWDWQLGGGWVTWLDGSGLQGILHAYRLRDGRHDRWFLPTSDPPRMTTAAHTATRVYVSAVSAAGGRTRVHTARLPR